MESMVASQTMSPASFYYYSPDPNPENRQHGHFVQQPQQQQMPVFPIVPTLPSTPMYSRPSSSCSQQQQLMQPRAVTSIPSNMTPVASPQPVCQKPTIVLETQICDADGLYYPTTPPLSTSGSAISSPGSCDMLATPLNPMFSGLDGLEGVKDDAHMEKFPVLDWSNCASPPLTPGVYLPVLLHFLFSSVLRYSPLSHVRGCIQSSMCCLQKEKDVGAVEHQHPKFWG